MLQDIEANNEKIQTGQSKSAMCKTFSLAPIYSIKSHFIDIDNTALKAIISELRKNNESKEQKEELCEWKHLFNLKGLLTQNQLNKGFHFAEHVQTDGTTLCFMIKKPVIGMSTNKQATTKKRKLKSKNDTESERDEYFIDSKSYNPYDRVIAIDPGRTNIAYAIEKNLSTGQYQKYKFTRKQFYEESGARKASAKTSKWIKDDEMNEIFTELSVCSLKTTQESNWKNYFKTYMKWKDKLWEHHTQRKYGRLRFKSYILRNRSMDRFLGSLHKNGAPQKPIIAYGDGSFASTGKGEKAIPNKTFYEKCKRYYKTVLVNEFRTTALCSCCHNRLLDIYETVKTRTIEKAKERIDCETFKYPMRGLKWCDSTKCRFKYVCRDYNAAVNIEQKYHWQAMGENMPANFTELKQIDSRDKMGNVKNFIRLVSVIDGSKRCNFGHL